MLRILVIAVLLLGTASVSAYAKDYAAKHVEATDGVIKCLWARDRIVTVISGPCDSFTAPSKIKIGEKFVANGKVATINFVIASEAEKDMPSVGLRKGDWTCVAAESKADVPIISGKEPHTGTWLYVKSCKAIE